MAFELNHETLNPQPIEKTKVSLASRICSESTRNAVKFYTENGYPHWEGTLKFLQIIAKWWNILNVKTAFKGIHKRNPDCQPITVENLEEVTLFFQKIVDWVDEWRKSKKAGLSTETFKSFHQTSTVIPLLAHHLLHEHGFEYVLTGKIQSDFLEKRFGRYRQLSGANYFATETILRGREINPSKVPR